MKMTMTKLVLVIPLLMFVVYVTPVEAVICPSISDVYIDEFSPYENFNYKTRILISYHPSKGIARGLIMFDISEAIDASEITAATLHLSGSVHTGGGDAMSINCYALNEPFCEGSDTWNTYHTLSEDYYDSSISSTGSLPAGSDWETSIDVTALATGNLEKLRDYGMLIRLQNENSDGYQNIASRECIDPEDFAPYLDIEYSQPSSSSTTSEPVETSTTSAPATSTTSSVVSTSTSTTTIFDDTTTIITSSTTTGRIPPCLIETIYGEESDEVLILRYFRDHVLQSTREGREVTQLYYAWSPFIVSLIERDPGLQYDLRETIDTILHDFIAND